MTVIEEFLSQAIAIVAKENEALRRNDLSLLRDNTDEKVRIVAALSNFFARDPGAVLGGDPDKSVKKLLETLTENQRLLLVQLQAANNAADAISEAVRGAQSDGTYSRF